MMSYWTDGMNRVGLRGEPVVQLPRVPTYKGHQNITGINWNYFVEQIYFSVCHNTS
jgi:hypothetical protein